MNTKVTLILSLFIISLTSSFSLSENIDNQSASTEDTQTGWKTFSDTCKEKAVDYSRRARAYTTYFAHEAYEKAQNHPLVKNNNNEINKWGTLTAISTWLVIAPKQGLKLIGKFPIILVVGGLWGLSQSVPKLVKISSDLEKEEQEKDAQESKL